MTIAACYVSPEGVVLGADSTTTFNWPGDPHYFNHAQKLFEIGAESTLGLVTWGIGGLGNISYRRLIAELGDDLSRRVPDSVEEVTQRWIALFWEAYNSGSLKEPIEACRELDRKPAHDPAAETPAPDARSEEEERRYQALRSDLVAGFCIGGNVPGDRTPAAWSVIFDPLLEKPEPVRQESWCFWGAPNMIRRLIFGCDEGLKQSLLNSGKWSGTREELDAITYEHMLAHPILPIRDAIDFVHTCLYSTIKALKFSSFSQICGGPIEIALITADRPFRWVRHKTMDAAIAEGEPRW